MEWIMTHKLLLFILSLVAILLCILACSEKNTHKNKNWQLGKASDYEEYKQKDVEHK